LIKDIRRKLKRDIERLQAAREQEVPADQVRPSEEAMRDSERFKPRPKAPGPRQRQEAERNLQREAEAVAKAERRDRVEVIVELEEAAAARPYKVEFRAVEEGPFYRPTRLG